MLLKANQLRLSKNLCCRFTSSKLAPPQLIRLCMRKQNGSNGRIGKIGRAESGGANLELGGPSDYGKFLKI